MKESNHEALKDADTKGHPETKEDGLEITAMNEPVSFGEDKELAKK
jgi:hypothetical protein